MSDLMLYGVLRMPYDMAMSDELSRRQFYSRVQEAVSRMEVAEAKLEELNGATPPSPSTAPTCCACEGAPSGSNNPCAVCGKSGAAPIAEGEREAFEAWAESALPYSQDRLDDGSYCSGMMDRAWLTWQARAALASRPAAEVVLPPLPESWSDGEHDWAYTADQMRAYGQECARAAVEADRRSRISADQWAALEAARLQAEAAGLRREGRIAALAANNATQKGDS